MAGGGEGDRDGRRVTGPDIGPTVAGAGDRRPGAAVGQCPEHEQRACVHPPRPGRRTAPERPGRGQPAPVGGGGSGPSEPADDGGGAVAEPGDGPQHVGSGQVALVDAVGVPERDPSAVEMRSRDDRRAGRHRPGDLELGRYLHQRPSRPERANVDDVSVGVDRPDGPPVPDEGGAEERGRHAGNRRRGCRVGPRPPERARAAATPTHTAAAARVLCIPQCNQPFGPPVASLACAAQRPRAR